MNQFGKKTNHMVQKYNFSSIYKLKKMLTVQTVEDKVLVA
jgi:hypothetical protein